MSEKQVWVMVYSTCRNYGDDHATASSNASAAVEATKTFGGTPE
jgi:hypothetical protein